MDLAPELTRPRKRDAKDIFVRYAVAVCSVGAGLALRFALGAALGSTLPYITFFPAIMLAAWFGGLGPGILAMLLSLAAVFYFALEPLYAANSADAIGAFVFVGVSVFISILNEALRRSRARSDERFRQLALEAAWRSSAEEALVESKRTAERDRDLLHITLSSIGDAVITADAEGRVTFLNAVAQELTGWSDADAAGKAISDVFVIRNGKTGLAVASPVEKAIQEGVVIGIANHTVLINKNGRHIPIEDSASPIRDKEEHILGVVLVFRDVTDRRASEDAVKRSEDRLKLALDAGKIGVWDWDVVQNRIEWSDLVYDIHGVERGKFRGGVEDFAGLVHPEDRGRVNKAISAALLDGSPYDIEFRVIHPNGKLHWVATTARVFRNEMGEAIRMLGATTDVTARKEAEARLLRQWRTFDTALSNTPDFTYIFDLAGRFTYINHALLSLWQRSLEDAVGKNFFELEYPPELAGHLQRQIQQVIDTKEAVRDQTPFTGPTGETRHYEYIFVPVFAATGQVEAVAGSTRDVTERNEAEEALRKSEERLTFALEAGGGVGTWDWDIAPAGGAPIAEFLEPIHPDDRGRVDANIRHAIEAGGDFAEEYRVVPRYGPIRWVYARGRCHLDKAGNPVRFPGVIFEITELKRAEENLLQSNEELKRVNRELEEFAYVASHDLQEPLRTVNIYTQLILRDIGPESEKLSQYAGFIQRGVTRMEALIRDLLTFSRSAHAEERPVGTADLSTSFGEALSVLKDEIERSAAVITADPLPMVQGDTSQMAHVFQNLLSNALKYRKKDASPEIRVSAEDNGGRWVVSVRDNGIGFDPRYADRIFGLFKRLHTKEYVGTGLGLAICKRIVERYGGRIWAESRPDEGAVFHFSLPKGDRWNDMS
jgi:PAS domain S-box-containing protein